MGGSILDRRLDEIRVGPVTVPFDFETLEREALETLPDAAREYARVGAGTGGTRRANEAAFDAWRVLPRVLRDTAERDLSTTLFGEAVAGPLAVAPVGRHTRYHPEGELATARAAADLDVPFTVGTPAAHPLEAVAEAADGAPQFFQLYPQTDWAVTRSLIERAEAAGYAAVLVTVDTLANRWTPSLAGDARRGDSVMPNVAADPVAQERGLDAPGALSTVDSLTWTDLERMQGWTDLPVVVKGVTHPADARAAVEHGLDGVVVSNHGGRAVDGAVATLDVLPVVADAVDGAVPILVDGGVRTGVDVLKAVALGADAALVGRPFVYGLSLAGERGVYEVLHNLLAELDSALGMAGYGSLGDVGPEALVAAETLSRARRAVDGAGDWFPGAR